MNDVDSGIIVSADVYALQNLKQRIEIERLKAQLEAERSARAAESQPEHHSYKQREVTLENNMFQNRRTGGVLKARPAQSIRSYDDFKAMQDYYLSRGKVRDWCLWTVGVGLGFRVSDLLSLRFKSVYDEDGQFRSRVQLYEKKTGKLNDALLTEGVANAIARYVESIGGSFNPDHFIFSSQKGKGTVPMAPEYAWRVISNAAKAIHLPLNFGSHTMRKSFANIVACTDRASIDMNVITKVQGLLNHSDQRTTMLYLGSFKEMYDKARMKVSDFILGKSPVNSLVVTEKHTLDELFERLDSLERRLDE